ncbi:MAG: (d)CMP kinase [Ginsengibacter sp.]
MPSYDGIRSIIITHFVLLLFFATFVIMAKKIIITIDGWSSCGKSTLAKQLAEKLDYLYIDSGAMYRAITLYFLRNNINSSDQKEIRTALKNIVLEFSYNEQSGKSEIYLNGENVEYIIRDLVIAEKVSEIAALKDVRKFAVAVQQKIGIGKGIVMDGRDIGTTVFPNAEIKIFMVADEAVRVERRFSEMFGKNPNISLMEIKANIAMRDYIDSHREVSPLRKAGDAIELNNTKLTEKEQLDFTLKLVKKRLKEAEVK